MGRGVFKDGAGVATGVVNGRGVYCYFLDLGDCGEECCRFELGVCESLDELGGGKEYLVQEGMRVLGCLRW